MGIGVSVDVGVGELVGSTVAVGSKVIVGLAISAWAQDGACALVSSLGALAKNAMAGEAFQIENRTIAKMRNATEI